MAFVENTFVDRGCVYLEHLFELLHRIYKIQSLKTKQEFFRSKLVATDHQKPLKSFVNSSHKILLPDHLFKAKLFEVVGHHEYDYSVTVEESGGCDSVSDLCNSIVIAVVERDPVVAAQLRSTQKS